MCNINMCRYVHLYVVCLFITSTYTSHVCGGSPGAHKLMGAGQTVGPRLKVQQELRQQLRCLWFQKVVHV